jgi:hypothetical protein
VGAERRRESIWEDNPSQSDPSLICAFLTQSRRPFSPLSCRVSDIPRFAGIRTDCLPDAGPPAWLLRRKLGEIYRELRRSLSRCDKGRIGPRHWPRRSRHRGACGEPQDRVCACIAPWRISYLPPDGRMAPREPGGPLAWCSLSRPFWNAETATFCSELLTYLPATCSVITNKFST